MTTTTEAPAIVTVAQRIRQLALQALIESDPTATTVAAIEAGRLLKASTLTVRPLFAEYAKRLGELTTFGENIPSWMHGPNAEHVNSDREADRLDEAARDALTELLNVNRPAALSDTQIEAAHEARGCHKHYGPMCDDGVCCVCDNNQPCDLAIDLAREWVAEVTA